MSWMAEPTNRSMARGEVWAPLAAMAPRKAMDDIAAASPITRPTRQYDFWPLALGAIAGSSVSHAHL